ncbi:hypothetical protein [Nocardioides sp. W7]|uniref:beta strand repeat-containing protein n=1 Tax=Nocardioides sp. W7 TaxID=2931390 RepID=UPI001FD04D0C|nr:hypothetical protein [Nocardioides sp. W7]
MSASPRPLGRLTVALLAAGVTGAGTVLAAPVAHAATPFESFAAGLSGCTGAPTIALGDSFTEPEASLVVACNATLDLSGRSLSVNSVDISAGRTLTIRATGGGSLSAVSTTDGVAGINTTGATLVVDAGTIVARGGYEAAGIGGGDREPGGTTTINGGTVTATGNVGSGIGGGDRGDSGTITITGGSVEARGDGAGHETGGAGIGAGRFGTGGATITGGTVVAVGGLSAAGIGGGQSGNGGSVTISGGNVATYPASGAAGIGGGDNLQFEAGLGNGGSVVIGAGAVVTVMAGGFSAVGAGFRGSNFGSLTVDGTLKLPSGALRIADSTPTGAEVTVGATGQILGSDADPTQGGSITGGNGNLGTGQVDNHGVIALATARVSATVNHHNYRIAFARNDGGNDTSAVTVFATSFDLGYRTLPALTRTHYSLTGWNDEADGTGIAFTSATALSGPRTVHAQWAANTIVVGTPTISGTARVGETLSVVAASSTPADATADYAWTAGGTSVGDGTSYVVRADDLGQSISVTQTMTKANYPSASRTSSPTKPVVKGTMTAVGSIVVTGAPTVGRTLTATSSVTTTPSAGAVTGRWYRDGVAIDGATAGTLLLTSADLTARLSYRETRTRAGYDDLVSTSDQTAPVGRGTLVATGAIEITGTPKVGQVLTAVSTVGTTPASTAAGQWYRDGVPVDGATTSTYLLTNSDVSTKLRYRQTRTLAGYDDVTTASAETERVTGGIIDLGAPGISGTPVVDQLLTVVPGTLSPADAAVGFTWAVAGVPAGAGETYTVRPGDVGQSVTVTADATRTDYDPVATESAATAPVATASFTTGPDASLSGVLKVGERLTAGTGTPTPAPDSLRYQWYADGRPIDGATDEVLTLTGAQKGSRVSVGVSAVRAGYDVATSTSEASAVVVTNLAPGLTMTAPASRLRLGSSTTITWTSLDAVTMESSGAWSGVRAVEGSESVSPTRVGSATYLLTATNGSGTTTAQLTLDVALPATRLELSARRSVLAPGAVTIRGRRLAGRESYTITLGPTVVATGRADAAGRFRRTVRVPDSVRAGRRTIRVLGSLPDRVGTRPVQVVRTKPLHLTLRDSVRASDPQRATVRNLLPNERVTLTYRGRRISPVSARANRRGVYTLGFHVGMSWGAFRVSATGAVDGRSVTSSFRVVKRCPGATHRCP